MSKRSGFLIEVFSVNKYQKVVFQAQVKAIDYSENFVCFGCTKYIAVLFDFTGVVSCYSFLSFLVISVEEFHPSFSVLESFGLGTYHIRNEMAPVWC